MELHTVLVFPMYSVVYKNSGMQVWMEWDGRTSHNLQRSMHVPVPAADGLAVKVAPIP